MGPEIKIHCSGSKWTLAPSNGKSSQELGKNIHPEDVVGKTIVVFANLKPAKLMGVEFQGMVLTAEDKDVF